MVLSPEEVFKAGNHLYMSRKAPPTALQSARALKVLFSHFEDVSFPPESVAMTPAGKGIRCRDANNYFIQYNDGIATIGRRNVVFTIAPKDLPFIGVKQGNLVGIVGDVAADKATAKNTFHFVCVPDREDEKCWDVVGVVNLPNAVAIYDRAFFEAHFLKCARAYMERRMQRNVGKKHGTGSPTGSEVSGDSEFARPSVEEVRSPPVNPIDGLSLNPLIYSAPYSSEHRTQITVRSLCL